MLTKGTNLRFWCQKVLPLVYDDSLSYYELLNKVVLHLNQNTENINQLIDFYNTFAEDVEDIIRQMMEDGDFNEIVADTLGSIVAEEYDPTKSYIIFDYCIFDSKLYRANGSTTGVFDPEKWVERTVGYDLATIQNYIYTLNAGNVAYDPTASYDSGTVGNKLKNLNANDVAYNPTASYNNDTVGKEIINLNGAINSLNSSITTLNATHYATLDSTNIDTGSVTVKRFLNVICVSGNVLMKSGGIGAWLQTIMTLPSTERPSTASDLWGFGTYDGTPQWIKCEVLTDGTVRTRVTSSGTHSITDMSFPNSIMFG